MMSTRVAKTWLERLVLMVLFCTASASTLAAQTHSEPPEHSFAAAAGEELRRQADTAVRTETRRSDSLLNGALIGAGVAVASGLLFCRTMEPWENCRDDVGPMLRIGALGAAIGIGIDALIRERVTTYQPATRLRVAPIVAPRGSGVQLSVRF
jgi:hypothetical protein